MSLTLDANVLLYASDAASPRHDQAREMIERVAAGPELAYLFWPTIMAYLRIATHPAIFDRPLPAVGTDEVRQSGRTSISFAELRAPLRDALPAQ